LVATRLEDLAEDDYEHYKELVGSSIILDGIWLHGATSNSIFSKARLIQDDNESSTKEYDVEMLERTAHPVSITLVPKHLAMNTVDGLVNITFHNAEGQHTVESVPMQVNSEHLNPNELPEEFVIEYRPPVSGMDQRLMSFILPPAPEQENGSILRFYEEPAAEPSQVAASTYLSRIPEELLDASIYRNDTREIFGLTHKQNNQFGRDHSDIFQREAYQGRSAASVRNLVSATEASGELNDQSFDNILEKARTSLQEYQTEDVSPLEEYAAGETTKKGSFFGLGSLWSSIFSRSRKEEGYVEDRVRAPVIDQTELPAAVDVEPVPALTYVYVSQIPGELEGAFIYQTKVGKILGINSYRMTQFAQKHDQIFSNVQEGQTRRKRATLVDFVKAGEKEGWLKDDVTFNRILAEAVVPSLTTQPADGLEAAVAPVAPQAIPEASPELFEYELPSKYYSTNIFPRQVKVSINVSPYAWHKIAGSLQGLFSGERTARNGPFRDVVENLNGQKELTQERLERLLQQAEISYSDEHGTKPELKHDTKLENTDLQISDMSIIEGFFGDKSGYVRRYVIPDLQWLKEDNGAVTLGNAELLAHYVSLKTYNGTKEDRESELNATLDKIVSYASGVPTVTDGVDGRSTEVTHRPVLNVVDVLDEIETVFGVEGVDEETRQEAMGSVAEAPTSVDEVVAAPQTPTPVIPEIAQPRHFVIPSTSDEYQLPANYPVPEELRKVRLNSNHIGTATGLSQRRVSRLIEDNKLYLGQDTNARLDRIISLLYDNSKLDDRLYRRFLDEGRRIYGQTGQTLPTQPGDGRQSAAAVVDVRTYTHVAGTSYISLYALAQMEREQGTGWFKSNSVDKIFYPGDGDYSEGMRLFHIRQGVEVVVKDIVWKQELEEGKSRELDSIWIESPHQSKLALLGVNEDMETYNDSIWGLPENGNPNYPVDGRVPESTLSQIAGDDDIIFDVLRNVNQKYPGSENALRLTVRLRQGPIDISKDVPQEHKIATQHNLDALVIMGAGIHNSIHVYSLSPGVL